MQVLCVANCDIHHSVYTENGWLYLCNEIASWFLFSGNNFYGDGLRTRLEEIGRSTEREAYILMDRVCPPTQVIVCVGIWSVYLIAILLSAKAKVH